MVMALHWPASQVGETVLMTACAGGNVDIVRSLIEMLRVPTNGYSLYGWDALGHAARRGSLPIVKYLIEVVGMNPHVPDKVCGGMSGLAVLAAVLTVVLAAVLTVVLTAVLDCVVGWSHTMATRLFLSQAECREVLG